MKLPGPASQTEGLHNPSDPINIHVFGSVEDVGLPQIHEYLNHQPNVNEGDNGGDFVRQFSRHPAASQDPDWSKVAVSSRPARIQLAIDAGFGPDTGLAWVARYIATYTLLPPIRPTIPLAELTRAVAVLRPELADCLAELLAVLWSRRMLRRFGTDQYAINVDIHEWKNQDGTRFVRPAVAEFLHLR